MCVIIVKPKNVEIKYPDLWAAWSYNPDGAGLAYYDRGKIIVQKGFMEIDDFWNVLKKLKNKKVVLHLRYATHGKVNKHQTHPFAIVDSVNGAKSATDIQAALFHNGIVSNFGNDQISDTIDFTVKVLAEISKLSTRLKVLRLVGSKWALLQNGKVHLVGKFEKYRGLKCSNLNWTSYDDDYIRLYINNGCCGLDDDDQFIRDRIKDYSFNDDYILDLYDRYCLGKTLTVSEGKALDDILLQIFEAEEIFHAQSDK